MKFSRIETRFFLMLSLMFMHVTIAQANLITRINESDFINAESMDFLNEPLGSISTTDSLFTDFGISELTAVASAADGEEYARGDYQQALWAGETNGVEIVDNNGIAGCTQYDQNNKCIGDRKLSLVDYYLIDFSSDLSKIGFYMVDVWKPLVFTFYNNDIEIEVYDEEVRGAWDGNMLGTGTGWTAWRVFDSTVLFDQVRIESKNSNADGFGIGEIRKESVPVSEPSTLFIMALGMFGLISVKRRRKNIK